MTPPDLWSFRDLAGLVDRYRVLTSLIRTPEDLARLIEEFVEDEVTDGVLYTEPMFSPVLYAHRFRWSLEQAFTFMHKAFQKAAARYRIEVRYMIGANWTRPIDVIERLARFAAECADLGVVSFGFSGEEPAGSLEQYGRACAIARKAGLLIVPHVGETGGPANVRAALELLGAQRVAHGIGAVQDHELLRHLADRAVVCDVCPSSNLRLGIVPSLDQHPVRAMLDSGIAVTINADDPLFFRTSASEEIAHVCAAFSLSDAEVANLACAGLDASGASLTARSEIRTAVTRWLSHNFETPASRLGKAM